MILVGILAYFTVASVVLAMLVLPTLRDATLAWMKRLVLRACAAGGASLGAANAATHRSMHSAGRSMVSFGAAWAAHRITIIVAIAAIASPPFLVFALRPHVSWHAYDENTPAGNAVVGWLLRGEQLVPPPPLPPDVFTTREMTQERPELASANRDWSLIGTRFRRKLLEAFNIMAARHGYTMVLIEGYRSPERQQVLAGLGAHVTRAGAFQSQHQYGLAADCAFFKDGRLVISERDPWAMHGYRLFGEVAESVGLTWGGRWTLMDFGHVELRRADSSAPLS